MSFLEGAENLLVQEVVEELEVEVEVNQKIKWPSWLLTLSKQKFLIQKLFKINYPTISRIKVIKNIIL